MVPTWRRRPGKNPRPHVPCMSVIRSCCRVSDMGDGHLLATARSSITPVRVSCGRIEATRRWCSRSASINRERAVAQRMSRSKLFW
jgi:hypothetical protein